MIETAALIEAARLALATVEGLVYAVDKAKKALDDGTAQLRDALLELEKRHDQLAADRAEADKALDAKFDTSAEGGE